MKATFTLFVLLIALSFRLVVGQSFSPNLQNRLQSIIDSFQNNPANPYVGGLAVAVKVDGLAEWKGVTGYAARNIDVQNNLLPGGTPFAVDDASRIYSVTKTFTAALTLELAGAAAFGLDDPVIKYLPLLGAVNPALNTNVTIRQLLDHESGYSDYTDEVQLQIAVAFDPTHAWTPYEMVSFVHQVSMPGTKRRYSSTNYILLGAVIEAATGKPVEQYFRERYFTPLHLTSMYLDGRETIANGAELVAPHDNISPFNPIFQLTGQPTFPDTYTNISRFPLTGAAAANFIDKGAYLGTCIQTQHVKNEAIAPAGNSISSFPNPFFTSTTIAFKPQQSGVVSLRVYDMSGKLVADIYNGKAQSKIMSKIDLDGTRLAPGVYIARLQTNSGVVEEKIIKSR